MNPMEHEELRGLIAELKSIDTPTVCNALELIDNNRRNFGYTDEPLFCLRPEMKPVAGIAKTATCRSLRASDRNAEKLKADRLEYYAYIDEGDFPKIVVMQDLDGGRRGHGPFWGEFNTRIHKALGVCGVVTDNTVRDVPNLPDGVQLLSHGFKPSHANIHIVEYNIQVNVASMVVTPGNIVHMDLHGAVCFPIEIGKEVIIKAKEFIAGEEPILEACRQNPYLSLDEIISLYLRR